MANSAKTQKEERVWDDPLPADKTPPPVSSTDETLLASQTIFLQDNPDCIYSYLKLLHRNNKRVTVYTVGFEFLFIAVAIHFIPALVPEITNTDLVSMLMIVGILMFIIAILMGRMK